MHWLRFSREDSGLFRPRAAGREQGPRVGMAVSGYEVRDATRLACDSVVVGRAVALAHWIGTGRLPVTAGHVLRKADVPAAGAAAGVEVPSRLRTMADIRALHRPWRVAVAGGLLQVSGGWVSGGPALVCWPRTELARVNRELKQLRAQLAALEEQRAALLSEIDGQGSPQQ